MRGRRLLALAALTLLAACTAIAGLDGDFQQADPATTTQDGSVADSSRDAANTVADGSRDEDAPADAGADAFDAAPIYEAGFADATVPFFVPCNGKNETGQFLCWDFGGNQTTAPFGWGKVIATGGGMAAVEGDVGDAGRDLHVILSSPTAAGVGEGLEWNDWGNLGEPGMQPLSIDANSGASFGFTFMVKQTAVYAVIAEVVVNGDRYGLAMYPTGCNGEPCLAQSGLPQTGLFQGARFTPNTRYRGQINIHRDATPNCSGDVLVGGLMIGHATDVFPSSAPTTVLLHVGALSAVPSTGVTETFIDDIQCDHTAN